MKTYDRDTYRRIQEAWRSFGPKWQPVRLLVAELGYPFPPAGEATDDREDNPSQRAIVWRALDFRPAETLAIIRRCRSWSAVIAAIVASEDNLHVDAALNEREAAWDRRDDPNPIEATMTVRGILERIGQS